MNIVDDLRGLLEEHRTVAVAVAVSLVTFAAGTLVGLNLAGGDSEVTTTSQTPSEDSVPDLSEDRPGPGQPQATRDIENLVTSFFSVAPDAEAMADRTQDGGSLAGTFDEVDRRSDLLSKVSTTISSVAFPDPTECTRAGLDGRCAQVVHDVLVDGEVRLPAKTTFAVRDGDSWLLARASVCDLLALSGTFCTSPDGG